ncbi:uncharacterized protein N7479_011406 [Penicillium vulpinum]|uniref:Glycoprotease family protein n=1 Tax=Penicillium vulpinum TaxID=29845 RepID=A0A1V6RXK0_9EURO|nr:uncharacterized protein N7479_011406 [Penicillium vulpinum]KAJ5952993.1 hypothetical protein N7479_011406 [Penicillium vulpinum]OQE06487.1 hypothetical protein PENVUL_c018G07211 [Penicillium vulpinum]
MLKRKPQDLQVPVPNFPLSSPISEEISSPSCSSEDQEERDRPFAFLSKATRQRLEAKTAKDGDRSSISAHRDASRLNVRITKKRRSVAKPVGLNLVTDFTLVPAPTPRKQSSPVHAAAPFVDLNDLKLLSKVREKERSAQKSKNTLAKRVSRGFQRLPERTQSQKSGQNGTGISFLTPRDEDPFHDRLELGISPSDRHVMIGLTVPRNESVERLQELDSAGTPLTPSIIVTPAPWNAPSNSSTEMLRPRATSSIYSQPTPRLWQYERDVPPVPAIPAQHSVATKTPGSENKYQNTLGAERNARALSTASIWEDDSPPRTPETVHPRPKVQQQGHLSVNTQAEADRPESQGWWTYLLSPLMGKSIKSPLSPSFPQDSPSTPSPTTVTTRAQPKEWIQREKEISCFSPDTPETAAPIGEKTFEISRSFEHDQYQQGPERHQSPPPAYVSNVSSRQNTMSFMFSNNQTIQGKAAEYYQACAHELFSKSPYFECINHVCSITPAHPVVVPAGAINRTTDNNRGLALVALEGPGQSGLEGTRENQTPDPSTTSTKDAGLLIDIDSPRPETTAETIPSGYVVRAKEVKVLSPSSEFTSHTWDSSVVDEDEKGSVAHGARSGISESRSRRAASPPVPVPVPVVAPPAEVVDRQAWEPSAFASAPAPPPAPVPMPEPTPAPAPAPAPAPQIITNISPPVTNFHYTAPAPQPQVQPVQPTVQYVPVFAPQAVQPQPMEPIMQQPQQQEPWRGIPDSPMVQPAPQVVTPRTEWPWGQRERPQEQPQVQQPATQGHTSGFEWAYVQQGKTQELPITQESPQGSQVVYGQGPPQARQATYGHAGKPQGPPVIQGRQSGSGWPFGLSAHPHSNAPPAPPLPQNQSTGSDVRNQQEQPQASMAQDRQHGSEERQTEQGLPQGSALTPPQGHLQPSEPISPGFQRAVGGPGSIPMSNMQAPAPTYTQIPRDPALPPRYDTQPRYNRDRTAGISSVNPSGAIGPHETRRRRLEKEEATGRRVCNLWRGRGPFSKKSGRPGREGRIRRRWYFVICIFFFIIVALATILAIILTRKGDATPVQSRWLNLTGYPPMPTGIATLAGTEPQLEKSACITPSSMWSCALPKEQQDTNEPYNANQPNFRVSISFRNGTYDNSTTVGSKLRIRGDDLFNPSPEAPRDTEQSFIGQYTDNNSVPYAGESTPFYMSVLSTVSLSSASIYRRSDASNGTAYPNISAIIPPPDENADGTPAAAMLYPLPSSQPIRLYNRGLPTEHYGFYSYFDKSIFLSSQTQSTTADTNGGISKSKAHYRCTWSQTRLLVQIWTQPDKIGRQLLPQSKDTATNTSSSATPTSTNNPPTSSSSATDFSRPGSFPYPVTITVDRHGGAEKKKMVYCYPLEDDGHYNITAVQLQLEDRAVGGELVNPASGLFKGIGGTKNSTIEEAGGVDGGSGGCGCQWVNWISSV